MPDTDSSILADIDHGKSTLVDRLIQSTEKSVTATKSLRVFASSRDGVDAPRRHLCAKMVVSNDHLREASMGEVTTIGLDLAKQVFHVHGADASGAALFSRRLTRAKLIAFFASQPRCLVAMEACGGAHHWGRELERLGHEVRLIPPAYVKPFVKRQKNDAKDAED
jgi:transposase